MASMITIKHKTLFYFGVHTYLVLEANDEFVRVSRNIHGKIPGLEVPKDSDEVIKIARWKIGHSRRVHADRVAMLIDAEINAAVARLAA